MRSTELAELFNEAEKKGWVIGTGPLARVRRAAKGLGWTEQANRTGEPSATRLTPSTREQAKPRSLSATYGLGAQPLHTDGAHLQPPPDILLLHAEHPNATPTILWNNGLDDNKIKLPWDASKHGVFMVQNGPSSFFVTALTGRTIRYDPGCMVACDMRARAVARYFSEALKVSHTHRWRESDEFVLIDNRRTLHARGEVEDADLKRELHRVAFLTGDAE